MLHEMIGRFVRTIGLFLPSARNFRNGTNHLPIIADIMHCLSAGDSSFVQKYFSKRVKSDLPKAQLDDMLNAAFEYCNFTCITDIAPKYGASEAAEIRHSKRRVERIDRFQAHTDDGIYHIAARFVDADDFDHLNVGLYAICIKKAPDEAERVFAPSSDQMDMGIHVCL